MSLKDRQNRIIAQGASNITKWVGSPASVSLHTLLFLIAFILPLCRIIKFESMLLVLTTIVSLEAIYLSIFIQMSINMNNQTIVEIGEGIEELSDDIEELGEDIEDIQKDVEDVQKDVEDIQEDVEEIQEEGGIEEKDADVLASIQETLEHIKKEISLLKTHRK